MVHFLTLYQLKPTVTDEKLEEMIRSSRSQLLRISEVLYLQTGRTIRPEAEWPFFVAIDVESSDKLRMCLDDPVYIKFKEEVIRPFTTQ
ncbi:MAG: Dabb family protein, partial [Verrucomicrobiales bacterium]